MPMPTMSPALIVEMSMASSVSSTMRGGPYDSGVAPASTYSQRGVITPMPNDTWLGLTRCIDIRGLRAALSAGAREHSTILPSVTGGRIDRLRAENAHDCDGESGIQQSPERLRRSR